MILGGMERDEPPYGERDHSLERRIQRYPGTKMTILKANDEVAPWVETWPPYVDRRTLLPKEKKSPPSSTKEFGSTLWS